MITLINTTLTDTLLNYLFLLNQLIHFGSAFLRITNYKVY